MLGLARIIGDFEKPRAREIEILLYNYTPRKYIQRLVSNLKSTFDTKSKTDYTRFTKETVFAFYF